MGIYQLAQRHGVQDAHGTIIDLKITHQELAEMVNTSRETVTRVIAHLREEGIIEVDQRRMTLLDPQALLNRGAVLAQRGAFEAALVDLSRAVEVSPRSLLARLNRAGVRLQLHDREGAREDLEWALKEMPPGDPRRAQAEATLQRLASRMDEGR